MYVALKTLAKLSSLFKSYENVKELASRIVKMLCNFVITMCRELYRLREGLVDKQRVRLTVQAFCTITGSLSFRPNLLSLLLSLLSFPFLPFFLKTHILASLFHCRLGYL